MSVAATCVRGRRLVYAFAGGAAVGLASRIAAGCTSGLALSGGAVLAPGDRSWVEWGIGPSREAALPAALTSVFP